MSGSTGTITAPPTLGATIDLPAAIAGVALSSPNANYAAITVTLAVSSGTLLVLPFPVTQPQAAITGQATGTVTITGDVATVAAELALVSVLETSPGSSTLTISATDTYNDVFAPQTVLITPQPARTGTAFAWSGPSGGTWSNAGNWTVTNAPAPVAPDGTDTVTLGATGSAATTSIGGLGVAAGLTVAGDYTLTGVVDDLGAAQIGGTLSLLGSIPVLPAALLTAGATLTSATSIANISLGQWTNTGNFSVGAGGLFLRSFGTLDTGAVTVAAAGELAVDPSSTLAATGTIDLSGLLVGLGSISAAGITFEAGSDSIVQGQISAATISVVAGALVDGAGTIGLAGGTITNASTLEGAIAVSPLDLKSSVGGSGVLLIDPGGGLQLDGAVAAGQTVTFAPGVTPLYLDANGAGGGALYLTDASQFAGTIEGFTAGDRLVVVPAAGGTITSAMLVGSTLELKNSAGTILSTLAVDPTQLPSGTAFNVAANTTQDLFSFVQEPASAVEITAMPANGLPQLTTSGGMRLQAGLVEPIPLVSAYDPAGYTAGDTFTLTMTAQTGTLTELLSIPLFLGQLLSQANSNPGGISFGALFNPRAVGNGSADLGSTGLGGSGQTSEPISVTGTGTGTLTVSSNNLLLLNLQSALLEYQAATSGSTDTITVTFTDGTQKTSSIVPVSITTGGGSAFSWAGTGSASAGNAADWRSATGVVGPLPNAQDTVTLGAGNYAITGDFSAQTMTVSGRALTQGAIFVGNSNSASTALTVQNGGIFGSAGFLYVNGNTTLGAQGSGELDTVGLINNIAGNLVVGGSAGGLLQVGGLLAVNNAILVGVGASGTLDLAAAASASGLGLGGLLADNSATLGVSAGESGLAIVNGASWFSDATLVVGGAGNGTLQSGGAANVYGSVYANNVIVGQSLGSVGFIHLDQTDISTTGTLDAGVAGQGTIVVDAGSVLRLAQSQAASGPEFAGTLNIGGAASGAGLVSLVNGGAIYGDTVNVGAGGQGTLAIAPGSSATLNFPLGTTDPAGLGTLDISATGTAILDGGLAASLVTNAGSLAIGPGNNITVTTGQMLGGRTALLGGSFQAATMDVSATAIVAGFGRFDVTPHTNPDLSTSPATIDNAGTIMAQGGLLDIESFVSAPGGHGTLEIGTGGTLQLYQTIDTSQAFAFAGPGALTLRQTFAFAATQSSAVPSTPIGGTISGFGAGDLIDLATVPQASIAGFANGQLTIDIAQGPNYGAVVLPFATGYSAANFVVQSDAAGGEQLAYVACFATGTHIRTANGETAVEDLRPGDKAVTAAGTTRPIIWIGRRAIDCRHQAAAALRPVRVAAHAFGPGLPARPLLLSPDHALFLNGVLIPVRELINGTSIVQPPCDRVVYWHVELDSHDILLAEGLPAESYLDTGNRHAFANAGVLTMALPHFERPASAGGCAPLALSGPAVEAARRLLQQQAPAAASDKAECG